MATSIEDISLWAASIVVNFFLDIHQVFNAGSVVLFPVDFNTIVSVLLEANNITLLNPVGLEIL
jgi:hypothetical protein